MWMKFAVGSRLVPRFFFSRLSGEKPSTQTNFSKFQLDLDPIGGQHEPQLRLMWLPLKIFVFFSYTCRIASTTVIVLPVPGGPNNRYGVGRHWPLTIRQTAALWRSFRDVLYKKSSDLCLVEDSALLSFKGAPLKTIKQRKTRTKLFWNTSLSQRAGITLRCLIMTLYLSPQFKNMIFHDIYPYLHHVGVHCILGTHNVTSSQLTW